MIKQIKLYISNSLNPYDNLATEKLLLDNVPDDCCTLYLWQNKNTIVIGRNQNPWLECRCTLLESEGGKLARRLSGGGAVFHDIGNLNFTFLCSTENYDLQKQLEVIRQACAYTGIDTELSGRNDILANGRKFSGNAFYNSHGKSYHHGTLLINTDTDKMKRYLTPPKAKLEAKGIKSTKSRVVNLSDLSENLTCADMTEYMVSSFEKVYGMTADKNIELSSSEIALLSKKYSSWEYLYGTPIPFTYSCEERFSWGHVNLQFVVKGGIIQSVTTYTDSMDWTLPDIISNTLCGVKFQSSPIKKIISVSFPANIAKDFIRLIDNLEI